METSAEHNAQRHFSDVRKNAPRGLRGLFRRGPGVVNLRPPRWIKHALTALSILLVLSVSLFGARYFLTRGEVADFHPVTCLGTWQNPQAAQGPPESTFGDRPIDAETAAQLEDSTGEIFCGGFVPPEFETEGDLTGAALTLVWKLEGENVFVPEPIVVTSTASSTESEAPAGIPGAEPPPASETTTPVSVAPFWLPQALAQEVSPEDVPPPPTEPGPAAEPEPEPKPEEEPAPAPPPAAAEETPSENSESELPAEPEPAADASSTEQPIIIGPPLGLDLAPLTSSTVVSSTPTEIILPLPPPPDDNFLKISYSLDGQTWYELQKVNLINWSNLTIPLPVTTWEDMKRIQVSVRGIPSVLEKLPKVYLDGLLVEAQYELPPFGGGEQIIRQDGPDLPIIPLPGDRKAVPAELRANPTFKADEAASFDFDLDLLPASPEELPPAPPSDEEPEEPQAELAPVSLDLAKVRRSPPPSKGWLNFFMDALGLRESASAQMDPAEYANPPSQPTPQTPVVSEIIGPDGGTDLKPTLLTVGKQLRVSVPEPKHKLKPGRYRLRLWMLRGGAIYYAENDFTWGVLAVNFNKSIYTAGNTAKLSYGVLDDNGHTICDAKIETVVTSPGGGTSILTTENGGILRSPECGPITVTEIPDYSSVFKTGETGLYSVKVTATTDHGPRELTDKFEVMTEPEFDVERIGPTRIYPPVHYRMDIKVKANKHFRGNFAEVVPDSFVVFTNGASRDDGQGARILEWELDLAPGDETQLTYEFDAPDVSPELFKLGPASLGHFSETRQWQIASDAVVSIGRLFYGDTANAGTVKFQTRSDTDVWSTETSSTITPTASNINYLIAKHAPTRDEVFIATMHANGTLGMTKCVGSCDGSGDFTGDTGDNFTKTGIHNGTMTCDGTLGACLRPFDLAYEQLSGDALVVFGTSTTGRIQYCTFTGTSWSGSNCATPSTTTISGSSGRFDWIRLVPQGGEQLDQGRTNRILLIAQDANNDIFSAIWDGSSWTNQTQHTATGSSAPTLNMDGAWEATGLNRALVVWGENASANNDQMRYRTWDPATGNWSASSSVGANTESSFNRWLTMQPDPKSDRVCLISQGDGLSTHAWMWRATGTTDGFEDGPSDSNGAGAEGSQNIAVGCAWEKTNGGAADSQAIFLQGDSANADQSDYWTWDNTNRFSAQTDLPGAAQDDASSFGEKGVRGGPNGDIILYIMQDIDQELHTNYWATSTWILIGPKADPAGTTAGGDNIPPAGSANSESHGYYFIFNPYSAWSRNWQFFTDETSTTPSVAAAGQNVRPTSTIQEGNVFRLRVNIQELANTAATDARKKLQWVASTTCPDPDNCAGSNWTDVAEFSDSAAAFRYASTSETCSGCSDATALGSSVLTSSTQNGTYVVSGSAAPGTNMDFTALATTELDFPIKAQNATGSETYYFRIFDATDNTVNFRRQDTGATPCAGGSTCSYPSLFLAEEPDVAPSVSNMSFNGGSAITLTPNATTTVRVNFRVTDTNAAGCADVFTSGGVTTTVFRSGVTNACSASTLNCYIQATTTHNCSGGSTADATTTFSIYYFAQATDASSSFPSENWLAQVMARDGDNATGTATSSVELNSLVALEVGTSSIGYGQVNPGTNTGSTNQELPIKNAGNSSTTLNISGTALASGSFAIPTSSQHYATSTFTFGGLERLLSDVATAVTGFVIPRLSLSWTNTSGIGGGTTYHSGGNYNGRLYIAGGFTATSTVRFASTNATGSLSAWTTTTALPQTRYYHGGDAYNGYLYVVGGREPGDQATSSVLFAPINSTGSIGSWSGTTALPDARYQQATFANSGFLYTLGGWAGGVDSIVRFAPLNSTGSVGTWATTTALAAPRTNVVAVAAGGYVYAIGGKDSGNQNTTTVLFAPINTTGSIGAWTNTAPLPSAIYEHGAAIDNGIIYVAGGRDQADSGTSTVLFAPVLSDGSLGPWSLGTSLSATHVAHRLSTQNGYLYALVSSGGVASFSPIPSRNLYWGAEVPAGRATGTYSGTATYTAVFQP